MVNTKYEIVDEKVKLAIGPLPIDTEKKRKKVSKDPIFRRAVDIGHNFMEESLERLRIGVNEFLLPVEKNYFQEMLNGHGKAFAFSPNEIGCVDPKIMEPMVIFTIDHAPRTLSRF